MPIKLSIITINYNNAIGLAKTIESVVNQSYKEVEYIIIDGGSTDESINIIKKYQDKISYWISEPDRGIYHAMNKGIQQATGDYCQFLNSGDWLCSEHVVKRMLTHNDQPGIIIGNMLYVYKNGSVVKNIGSAKESTFLPFYRGTLNHSSAYIKRNLFDIYGLYDESLKIVSDWKFYLQAVGLHNETVTYLDIDVSYFDMTGISNQQLALLQKERQQVLSALLPARILKDYELYWFDIKQMQRLKRYWLSRKIVWLLERILFKIESWNSVI